MLEKIQEPPKWRSSLKIKDEYTATATVEAGRWGPPPVDEDWHSVCQAIYKGVEGAEWENLCHKFVEMNKAVNIRHQSGNRRVRALWKERDASDKRRRVRSDQRAEDRKSGSGSAGTVEQTPAESSIGLG